MSASAESGAVRPATPDDAAGIAEVHVASWRTAYAGIVPRSILDGLSVEQRADFWRGVAADPGEIGVWVVERVGAVVGFASGGPARDDDLPGGAGEVQAIYVHPDAWGVGFGRVLFDRVVRDLRERRLDPLVLWVLTRNRRGRAFYERQGWKPDGVARELDFSGSAIEEIRYRAPFETG